MPSSASSVAGYPVGPLQGERSDSKVRTNESYTVRDFFYPVVSWVSSDWQRYGIIRMGSSRFGKSVGT